MMYDEFDRLFKTKCSLLSAEERAQQPVIQTEVAGEKQIEPVLMSMQFRLSADREKFEAGFVP
jgi:hypothetical protein